MNWLTHEVSLYSWLTPHYLSCCILSRRWSTCSPKVDEAFDNPPASLMVLLSSVGVDSVAVVVVVVVGGGGAGVVAVVVVNDKLAMTGHPAHPQSGNGSALA